MHVYTPSAYTLHGHIYMHLHFSLSPSLSLSLTHTHTHTYTHSHMCTYTVLEARYQSSSPTYLSLYATNTEGPILVFSQCFGCLGVCFVEPLHG